MLITILYFILIVLRLWIGMRLVATAHDTGANSLNWLGVAFFISAVSMPFATLEGNVLGATPASLWLFEGIFILTDFAVILFINATFYQGRKSPVHWFLGLTFIGMVATLYGVAVSPSLALQNPWVASGQAVTCVIWAWQGWAGYRAWQSVAKERTVEDWVKARYQLVVWYSNFQIVASLVNVLRMLFALGSPMLSNGMGLISLVTSISNVLVAYLAWAAPPSFYRWLNRGYKAPEVKEMSEEALMRQMTRG